MNSSPPTAHCKITQYYALALSLLPCTGRQWASQGFHKQSYRFSPAHSWVLPGRVRHVTRVNGFNGYNGEGLSFLELIVIVYDVCKSKSGQPWEVLAPALVSRWLWDWETMRNIPTWEPWVKNSSNLCKKYQDMQGSTVPEFLTNLWL